MLEAKRHIELKRLLAHGAHREPLSKLGFFSKPSAIDDGPFAGNVMKVYKSSSDHQMIEQLVADHADYIQLLSALGVLVPNTDLLVSKEGKTLTPVIVQRQFDSHRMLRHQLENAPNLKIFIDHVIMMLQATTDFIVRKKEKGLLAGFHPTTRNYALEDDKLIYFDTFPPMNREQQAVNRYILNFAPAPDFVKPFIPLSALNRISDEYFDDAKMLLGIVGSACRLRPRDAEQILQASRQHIDGSALRQATKRVVSARLSQPPRLPWLWTTFRRIFQKEGAPNVRE